MPEKKAIKRDKFAQFLNVGTSENKSWARMGTGITDNSISYGAQVSSETFIHEENATNSIDSFAPQIPVTQYCYEGDDVFEFVDEIRKGRKTGGDAETEVLLVYLYDYTETSEVKHYACELNKCSIQIDSFGGAGGQRLQIGYNVLFNGDPTVGTCTISNGAPVIDE